MNLLIDSHCHLDLAEFNDDRDAVMARAQAAGVATIVTIGIDPEHSRAAIALADRYPQVYATVGIHPTHCAGFEPELLAELRELAGQPKVVAIGEIGLDFYWDRTPIDVQKTAFRAQLDLAAELGLPVVIHDRDAHDALRAEIGAWVRDRLPGTPLAARPFAGVLHSFSGDQAMAEESYDWGFVLGISGPVTFKNARSLHTLVQRLRPDRLVIETDAPYLTPHPHRGKRNEPAHVALVAAKLAELWNMPYTEVAAATTATARTLFGIR